MFAQARYHNSQQKESSKIIRSLLYWSTWSRLRYKCYIFIPCWSLRAQPKIGPFEDFTLILLSSVIFWYFIAYDFQHILAVSTSWIMLYHIFTLTLFAVMLVFKCISSFQLTSNVSAYFSHWKSIYFLWSFFLWESISNFLIKF